MKTVYMKWIFIINQVYTHFWMQLLIKNGMKMTYTIVSESEANLKEGKISVNTPIAQGLLGKKVGDVADIKVPQGMIQLEVLSISF